MERQPGHRGITPELPIDALAGAKLRKTESGIFYLDTFNNAVFKGHIRMDEMIRVLGYAAGVIYLNDGGYHGGAVDERAQTIYTNRQKACRITALPSISVPEGVPYALDHLRLDDYYLRTADVLRYTREGDEEGGDNKIYGFTTTVSNLDFLLTEGLIDLSEYKRFYNFDNLSGALKRSGAPKPSAINKRNSVVGQFEYRQELPALQPEEEKRIRDLAENRIGLSFSLMSPDEFNREVADFGASVDVFSQGMFDYLREHYRSIVIRSINDLSRRGAIDITRERQIESILAGGYFDDVEGYIRNLVAVSRSKQVIENAKLDGLRSLVGGMLQATADFALDHRENPIPAALTLPQLLKSGSLRVVDRARNSQLTRSYIDSLVPETQESLQVLITKMILAINGKRRVQGGYSIIESFFLKGLA